MRPVDADALIPLIQEEKIEGEILDIAKALGEGLLAETLNQSCDRHIKIIRSLPTIDAVPRKAFDRILWENDVMRKQLIDIGKPFGAKMDDVVKVVRCKDCKWHKDEKPGMVYCPNVTGGWVEDDWYCKQGRRQERR